MSDEEFLSLKKQIKEYCSMCHEINQSSLELKKEISELDNSFSKLQREVQELESELDILEVF